MLRPLSIRAIQDAVARHYNITLREMLTYHCRRYVRPRHVAMFLARTMTDRSLPQIAHSFGGCDTETVTYAAKKIARVIETDAALAGTVMAIRAELEAEMNTVP